MPTKTTEPGQEALAREATRRESAAAFHRLAEAIGSAIFIREGEQIRYVNRAAETITEYTREELLAMNFGDLFCPGSRELVISRGPMRLEDAQFAPQGEFKILTKSGAERCLDVTAATIEFDGASTTLISAFDLTERKRAESQAQLLAITDPLTGLGNYRRLLDVLHAEIERSGRTGRPFAILLLDLDGLKKINDGYGHLGGSRALCRLADILHVNCRAIDTAARYGGDEFAVILPETTAAAAGLVASRIRSRIAADSEQPAFTASIGVAIYPRDGKTIEALLRTADRELYGMKSHSKEEPRLSIVRRSHRLAQSTKSLRRRRTTTNPVAEKRMADLG